MEKPIDKLKPESELHRKTLKKLLEMLDSSEREMRNFYPRWNVQEKKTQAFIDLPKWEKVLKEMNDTGKAPKVISLVVPYSFATISTIVTYLIHTFVGRKPMFQVGSFKAETTEGARMMELVLQYNADHTRLIKHLFQFLQDGELYGLGVMRTKWETKKAKRTVWQSVPKANFLGMDLGSTKQKVREERTVYSGNDVAAVDPFMFFPDPRVPMAEVNKRGEFVFWRTFEGEHSLKAQEAQGILKWVDDIGKMTANSEWTSEESARNLLSGGTAHAGTRSSTSTSFNKQFKQIDQGSVEIIPSVWGLGESTQPEKWIFTIGNKTQIIQAEPADQDHGMHPVVVSEPYTMGYGFGQPGISDYLGPIQDTASWFVNSHISNVRTALNNMFIVDPSMVEVKDLKKPGEGKIIRLKAAARGRDVRSAVNQMNIQDVTKQHMGDLDTFMKMGDGLSAVNDNLKGLQETGGRRTATEVRTSGEAGASRLAAHARLISAQAIADLTEQMSINIQQYMDEEFYIQLVGNKGKQDNIHQMDAAPGVKIAPEMLTGDFYYPINNGTLPLDKVAMLDIWKEVFLTVAGDEQLRSQFDITGIFEHLAELGGAQNLEQFKVETQVAPDASVQGAAQAGNAIPIPQSGAGGAL